MIRIIGRLLAVSTLSVTMPSATDSQPMATAVSASSPRAATRLSGPVVGRNPMQHGDQEHDPRRDQRLDDAADDVTREHRRSRDGHRPEAGDDPRGHVHRHRDRRPGGRAGDRDDQDPRQHVGEIGIAPGRAVGRGAERRAAEPAPSVPPNT